MIQCSSWKTLSQTTCKKSQQQRKKKNMNKGRAVSLDGGTDKMSWERCLAFLGWGQVSTYAVLVVPRNGNGAIRHGRRFSIRHACEPIVQFKPAYILGTRRESVPQLLSSIDIEVRECVLGVLDGSCVDHRRYAEQIVN